MFTIFGTCLYSTLQTRRNSLQMLKGTNMATLFIFIALALGTISNHKNIMQYESQGLQNFCRTRIGTQEK